MEGHRKAIAESWGLEIDHHVREPIYHCAGGLPRLLESAHQELKTKISLAHSSDAFSLCFAKYQDRAKAFYAIKKSWIRHAYVCLLASSTKAKVNRNELIPLCPSWARAGLPARTYDDAAVESVGSYLDGESRFVVPPITFDDAVLERAGLEAPIRPSQLHPFLSADVAKNFGSHSATDRGRLFEKPFVYALYARYLLASWERKSRWVSLEKVLEGAVSASQSHVIGVFEVNLSGGVMETEVNLSYKRAFKNALTYQGSSAHHDAYIWCRKKTNVDATSAVPLQLRHRQAKIEKKLRKQLETAKARLTFHFCCA